MRWIIFDAMKVVFKEDTIDLIVDFVQKKKDIDKERIQELYLRGSLGEFSSDHLWFEFGFSDDYPEIEKEYLETYFELSDDFVKVVTELKKTYKIGMISNDLSYWSKYLREYFNIEKLFDQVIISGDVGYRKPNRKIYEIFLEKEEVKAEDCVFIDDIEENLITADEMGIKVYKFGTEDSSGRYETVETFLELKEKLL